MWLCHVATLLATDSIVNIFFVCAKFQRGEVAFYFTLSKIHLTPFQKGFFGFPGFQYLQNSCWLTGGEFCHVPSH